MSYTSYTCSGTSCETDGNVLISNHKFFPPNFPLYKKRETFMRHYPCGDDNKVVFEARKTKGGLLERVKPAPSSKPVKESFTQPSEYKTGCCGR